MSLRSFRTICSLRSFAIALAGACVLSAAPAHALPTGVATPNCNGCHAAEGYDGELSLTPQSELLPGEETRFVLNVRESHMSAAGFYVTTGGVGTFSAGTGGRVSAGELMHSRPNSASDGEVNIEFGWTPPSEPGGTEFGIFVVAANVDGTSDGDRAARSVVSLVWGCEPLTLHADLDDDGFGDPLDTIRRCAVSEGWADNADDCNDLVAFIYPGALEQANGRDDDCNGVVDDGIEMATLFEDADGDGFGSPFSASFEGQIGTAGYAPNDEDCNDDDPEIHPDILEICDGTDNDCDGQADEGTFEYCGIGRCAKRLDLCNEECVPGAPSPEACNGLDDDCDGFIDNGDALCPMGQQCVEFRCEATTAAPAPPQASESANGEEGPPVASSASSGTEAPAADQTPSSDHGCTTPTSTSSSETPSPLATDEPHGALSANEPPEGSGPDNTASESSCAIITDRASHSSLGVNPIWLALASYALRRKRS